MYTIVAHCPVCNAPIYAEECLPANSYGNTSATVLYPCGCQKLLQEHAIAQIALIEAQVGKVRGD